MKVKHSHLKIQTKGKGLYPITNEIRSSLNNLLDAQVDKDGLLICFIQHTSASLAIQENADPTARQDMEEFLDRLAPENQPWHSHTLEGPDDTTSHLNALLTPSHLSIPIIKGDLGLGRWQGVYLLEHRNDAHERNLILTLLLN